MQNLKDVKDFIDVLKNADKKKIDRGLLLTEIKKNENYRRLLNYIVSSDNIVIKIIANHFNIELTAYIKNFIFFVQKLKYQEGILI